MNIYLLEQDENSAYDTYDSAVVIAENEDEARKIHPSRYNDMGEWWVNAPKYGTWAYSLKGVKVTYLGPYKGTVKGLVICASFNAG